LYGGSNPPGASAEKPHSYRWGFCYNYVIRPLLILELSQKL